MFSERPTLGADSFSGISHNFDFFFTPEHPNTPSLSGERWGSLNTSEVSEAASPTSSEAEEYSSCSLSPLERAKSLCCFSVTSG